MPHRFALAPFAATSLLAVALTQEPPADPAARWRRFLGPDAQAPADAQLPGLLDELTALLGSPDPTLRDDVAYTLLARWLHRERRVPVAERRRMLGAWRTGLRHGIDTPSGDGVLRRSFSALALSLLAAADGVDPWLDKAEFDGLLDAALAYLAAEQDVRGFDTKLGWLHSVAHTADLLKFLLRSRHLEPAQQAMVLQGIAAKLGATHVHLVAGEDDRLALAVLSLAAREDFDRAAFEAWLAQLDALPLPGTPDAALAVRENRRRLLQALCTRLTLDARELPGLAAARAALRTALGR